jgi:hypothetical protein
MNRNYVQAGWELGQAGWQLGTGIGRSTMDFFDPVKPPWRFKTGSNQFKQYGSNPKGFIIGSNVIKNQKSNPFITVGSNPVKKPARPAPRRVIRYRSRYLRNRYWKNRNKFLL